MSAAKIPVAMAWIWGIGSLFVAAESTAAWLGRWVLVALAVSHAIECVVFLPKLRRAGGSLANHLAQTFVFGVAHVGTLREAPGD
ncbi:MAG: hypothetical protein QNK03_02190 [Myxococcota bacterium]|nr:hypothetical protein [Myxococcota bacterium]